MFLDKKGLIKIIVMAIAYIVIGSFSIAFSLIFREIDGSPDGTLLTLGLVMYVLCALFTYMGYYAESKGKLVNSGNKLVRAGLRPLEFIKQYEMRKNSDCLVVKKPSADVLRFVMVAYDLLGDTKNALLTADEMIAVSSGKKKDFAILMKVAVLYSSGRADEAEPIFNEVRGHKLDILSAGIADCIIKTDRAIAMGDYKLAEEYNLKLLERSFPKPDNLTALVARYELGKVYEGLGEIEKAIPYYEYCASMGGETVIKASAAEKLIDLR